MSTNPETHTSTVPEDEEPTQETPDIPLSETFIPPSITTSRVLSAATYTHHSPIPTAITSSTPCILGVDEAGRGPVLGPMVYAVAYMPLDSPTSSLQKILKSHGFDDSKKLTASYRSTLFQKTCTPGTDLYESVGWSCTLLSARDISAGMLRPGAYNLNAQAHDTTALLIRQVIESGVNVAEIYVDTVGVASTYQAKLQKQFPGAKVTVAKKADSLYPIVSAASVVAKVTRDAAIEVLAEEEERAEKAGELLEGQNVVEMGSGYPGDEKTKTWLKVNLDPVFGFDERSVRFSWRTVRDMLEGKTAKAKEAIWPDDEDLEEGQQGIQGFFAGGEGGVKGLESWYGVPVKASEF